MVTPRTQEEGRLTSRFKIVFYLLAGVVLALLLLFHTSGSGIHLGAAAPSFQLEKQSGERVSLEQLRGQVILLNFWATWCPPCRSEMPSLERLKRQLEGQGVVVITISTDEGWRAIDRFQASVPLTLVVLLDKYSEVADRYGVSYLPETFLIDARGVVVQKYQGPRDWTEPKLVREILSHATP